MTNELPIGHAAVVVWLTPEQKPLGSDFDVALDSNEPPRPNPEPWWSFEDAVTNAATAERNHDKLPWIKVGDRILSPVEVNAAYDLLRSQDNGQGAEGQKSP